MKVSGLDRILADARACTLCAPHLPKGPRPVVAADVSARILIIGQAPGTRVHATGIPWNDPSGDRLREWMGLDKATFYDTSCVAIVPMGFCYPGKGKSGDLPPRPECAPAWHEPIIGRLPDISLTLLLSRWALQYYLGTRMGRNVTETVRAWRDFAPSCFPLPHPSPRNNLWLRRNPWFEQDVVPAMKQAVKDALGRRRA